MILTAEQLSAALDIPGRRAEIWIDPLNETFERFALATPLQIAAFLAQVGHESQRLAVLVENLNYSSAGLRATFDKYFALGEENAFARKPEAIANRVYADRNGNGPEESGDGWRYRGRGLIQITGRDNYRACAVALRLPLVERPDLLIEPINAALSAGWFWQSRNLNASAEQGDLRTVTRKINGGLTGYPERLALYECAKKALGVSA